MFILFPENRKETNEEIKATKLKLKSQSKRTLNLNLVKKETTNIWNNVLHGIQLKHFQQLKMHDENVVLKKESNVERRNDEMKIIN